MTEKVTTFTYNDETLTTLFAETMHVAEGVDCDVYFHPETNDRDLGVIHIKPGCKTPLQKVIGGEETIEGLISGKGTLTIIQVDGTRIVHSVNKDDGIEFSHVVNVGEQMQWQAAEDCELVAFEICYPPYQDGRYENIDE